MNKKEAHQCKHKRVKHFPGQGWAPIITSNVRRYTYHHSALLHKHYPPCSNLCRSKVRHLSFVDCINAFPCSWRSCGARQPTSPPCSATPADKTSRITW